MTTRIELLVSSLSELYTAQPDRIKEIIDTNATPDINFTDNIVSVNGTLDYYAQFKSLRSLFSDVKHTVNSSEVVKMDGSDDVELRVENTQSYTIGGKVIALEVSTALSLKEQDGMLRCYKHIDVWKGKPASFQFMRRGLGVFSSMLVRAFTK